MDEKQKQFYRDLRELKDQFINAVGELAVQYGMDLIPMSFDDIFKFWSPALDKLIDKDFRHEIERKVKKLKKELNPVYRWFRKLTGR